MGSRDRRRPQMQPALKCRSTGESVSDTEDEEKKADRTKRARREKREERREKRDEGGGKPRPYGFRKKYPSHGVTFSGRPAF